MEHFHSLKRRAACGIKQDDIFTHTVFLLPGSWLGFIQVCLLACLLILNVHGEM